MRKRLASLRSWLADNGRKHFTTALDLIGFAGLGFAGWMVAHPLGIAVWAGCLLYVSGSLAGAPPIRLRRPSGDDDE